MPKTIRQDVIDSVAAIRAQLIPGPDKDKMVEAYIEDARQKRELLND